MKDCLKIEIIIGNSLNDYAKSLRVMEIIITLTEKCFILMVATEVK